MRADQDLEDWMHRKRVLWKGSQVGVTVVLDARGKDKNWYADHCLDGRR